MADRWTMYEDESVPDVERPKRKKRKRKSDKRKKRDKKKKRHSSKEMRKDLKKDRKKSKRRKQQKKGESSRTAATGKGRDVGPTKSEAVSSPSTSKEKSLEEQEVAKLLARVRAKRLRQKQQTTTSDQDHEKKDAAQNSDKDKKREDNSNEEYVIEDSESSRSDSSEDEDCDHGAGKKQQARQKAETSKRGASLLARVKAARAKRLRQKQQTTTSEQKKDAAKNSDKDKKRQDDSNEEYAIEDSETSRSDSSEDEECDHDAGKKQQARQKAETSANSPDSTTSEREPQQQQNGELEEGELEEGELEGGAPAPSDVKTEGEVSERGASVLARLRLARAKRLRRQRTKKKDKSLKKKSNNNLDDLQAMAEQAGESGDAEWAEALRTQIRKVQCEVAKDLEPEATASLLLYFPPPCAATDWPSRFLASDLPLPKTALEREMTALEREMRVEEPTTEDETNPPPKIETETEAPPKIEAETEARDEDFERDFHKIMTNVVTLGDFSARMRGFLKLSQVPVPQLLRFKSEAYDGTTLLMQVAKHGHAHLTALLVDDYAAPMNAQSTDTHATALHLARAHGHCNVVDALLQRGVDASLVDTSGSKAFPNEEVVEARYSDKSKKFKKAKIIDIITQDCGSDCGSGCLFRVQFDGYDDEIDIPPHRVRTVPTSIKDIILKL